MKVKRRKILVLLLTVVLLLGIFEMPINVFAASGGAGDTGVQPQYTNLQLCSVSFALDRDAGEAIVAIVTSFYSNTDNIAILVDFQRFENNKWKHFHYSLTRKDDSPATWETYATITPGYYYRAVVTVRLYANQQTAETVTLTTDALYY